MNIDFKKNTKLKIDGITYSIESVASYNTRKNANLYYKINLSQDKILVIAPEDKFAYIGKIENINCEYEETNTLQFNNNTFKLIGRDYQILNQIILGNVNNVEGDIDFIDYINEKETEVISLAITKDNKRKDVYATIIDFDNIEIIN